MMVGSKERGVDTCRVGRLLIIDIDHIHRGNKSPTPYIDIGHLRKSQIGIKRIPCPPLVCIGVCPAHGKDSFAIVIVLCLEEIFIVGQQRILPTVDDLIAESDHLLQYFVVTTVVSLCRRPSALCQQRLGQCRFGSIA